MHDSGIQTRKVVWGRTSSMMRERLQLASNSGAFFFNVAVAGDCQH
jgi:hypothetical protein